MCEILRRIWTHITIVWCRFFRFHTMHRHTQLVFDIQWFFMACPIFPLHWVESSADFIFSYTVLFCVCWLLKMATFGVNFIKLYFDQKLWIENMVCALILSVFCAVLYDLHKLVVHSNFELFEKNNHLTLCVYCHWINIWIKCAICVHKCI